MPRARKGSNPIANLNLIGITLSNLLFVGLIFVLHLSVITKNFIPQVNVALTQTSHIACGYIYNVFLSP